MSRRDEPAPHPGRMASPVDTCRRAVHPAGRMPRPRSATTLERPRYRRRTAMGNVNLTDIPAVPAPSQPAQRWFARLAFVMAAAATVLVVVVAGLRGSVGLILVGAG